MGHQPFTFFRAVIVDGRPIKVQVDLLSGEYGGAGKKAPPSAFPEHQGTRSAGEPV